MLKFYHSIKILLLTIVILSVSGILFYETTRELNPEFEHQEFVRQLLITYDGIKEFYLNDPYSKNILNRVEAYQNDFIDQTAGMMNIFTNLSKEKDFYNSTFIYMVSRKMDGMDNFVREHFSNFPALMDFIIMDRDKNILYKYGNTSFTAEYFNISNTVESRLIGQSQGVIENYEDTPTGFEAQIVMLFDEKALAKLLDKIDYPAFLWMNGKLYQNSAQMPLLLKKVLENPWEERKYYTGMKVLETRVYSINKNPLYTIGLLYPSRSLGSSIMIVLKILATIIILFFLYLFNRLIEKRLRQRSAVKPKKIVNNEEEERTDAASLDWLEKYVKNLKESKMIIKIIKSAASLLLLIPLWGFSFDWARNSVYKFSAQNLSNFSNLEDYDNISIEPETLQVLSNGLGWLKSASVDIGDQFVAESAFLSFSRNGASSNSNILLQVRNADNDEIILQKTFGESGKLDLTNIFFKNLYLYLEIPDETYNIFSFGLKRKEEIILAANDAWIDPILLFYKEGDLRVDFTLRFPAILDILLFDQNGRIVDYIARRQFFRQGSNTLFWNPEESQTPGLLSGTQIVYFRARSTDGKNVEVYKKFTFVKD